MLLGLYAENQPSDAASFKLADELSFDAALPAIFFQPFFLMAFFIGRTS